MFVDVHEKPHRRMTHRQVAAYSAGTIDRSLIILTTNFVVAKPSLAVKGPDVKIPANLEMLQCHVSSNRCRGVSWRYSTVRDRNRTLKECNNGHAAKQTYRKGNNLNSIFLAMEVEKCREILHHTSFMTICHSELRITNYELRITNYELRITNYELRITKSFRKPLFSLHNLSLSALALMTAKALAACYLLCCPY